LTWRSLASVADELKPLQASFEQRLEQFELFSETHLTAGA
jgi:hypothetical protein